MMKYRERRARQIEGEMCYYMVLNRATHIVYHVRTQRRADQLVKIIHKTHGSGTMDIFTSPCPKALGLLTGHFIREGFSLNRLDMRARS